MMRNMTALMSAFIRAYHAQTEGEKVFYDGVLADFDAEYGIILYDMSTKKRTVIHEEAQSCHAVAGYLLIENYEGETLVSVSQYDIANRKWVTVAAE